MCWFSFWFFLGGGGGGPRTPGPGLCALWFLITRRNSRAIRLSWMVREHGVMEG